MACARDVGIRNRALEPLGTLHLTIWMVAQAHTRSKAFGGLLKVKNHWGQRCATLNPLIVTYYDDSFNSTIGAIDLLHYVGDRS